MVGKNVAKWSHKYVPQREKKKCQDNILENLSDPKAPPYYQLSWECYSIRMYLEH